MQCASNNHGLDNASGSNVDRNGFFTRHPSKVGKDRFWNFWGFFLPIVVRLTVIANQLTVYVNIWVYLRWNNFFYNF